MKTIIGCFFVIGTSYGQSDFCSTATPITLTNGSACVNGTTIGATTDNFLYGACNVTSVNEVWYTYTATGANNDFTVNPMGLTNAEIVVYSGGCPGGTGVLEICNTSAGATSVSASWGFAPGTQVWIGVMSNVGIEGNFELCVDSYAPAPVGGNLCSTAIPICAIGTTTTVDMTTMGTTGAFPSCFWAATNRDVWFTFTCTVSGTIEWTATPSGANELDWAMYNTTLGCPGALVACNYSYDLANGSPIGMNDAITCVACPTDLAVGACGEYCSEYFVTAGQTYTIMIDMFSGVIGDLDFGFTNGTTAQIAPVSDFTVSPSVVCGPDMTVAITDNSVGGAPDWTFGNGNSSSGSNPPSEFYNVPGTYAITATINDPQCPATHTEFVQLVAPPTGITIDVGETCPLTCDGTSTANSIVGGDGVYTYTWLDNLMNPIGQNTPGATGLCAGNYTLQVTSSTCPALDIPVAITTINALDDPAFTLAPDCYGGNATVNGTLGGAFTFNTPPGDGAVVDINTGLITNGTPGATYDILYTTSGVCSTTSTQTVTALVLDDPSFNLTATCDGGTATVTGLSGGSFVFNTPPGDAAVVDPVTGAVTGGTYGSTYDILYTTNGPCPNSVNVTVTALAADDPTFAMTPTCDGGTSLVSGTPNGVFSFNTLPTDGAVIDPATGIVSGGTPGATYDVMYTTTGACVQNSTQQVTAISQDDPTFALSSTCDGVTANVTGLAGGIFSFTNPPGDGAVIDPVTGTVSGGTPGSSYDVTYTTNGACVASMDLSGFTLLPDDASFTMNPTCDGGTAQLLLGSPGGIFAFNVAPTDGAVIDPVSGEVTGGTPGNTYDVMYSTNGVCPASSIESVTAYSLPLSPIAGTDMTYCSTDVYADMTASGAGGTFTWYDDAGLTNIMGTTSGMQPYDLVGTNTYYVTETVNGCEGPESMVTITVELCDIVLPTAFTPNGDNVNDTWEIVNLDNVYPNNVVWVYNRWGNLLFQSEPGQYNLNPWDGTYKGELLPVSSYYFIIEFNDKDENTEKGTVTLILK